MSPMTHMSDSGSQTQVHPATVQHLNHSAMAVHNKPELEMGLEFWPINSTQLWNKYALPEVRETD